MKSEKSDEFGEYYLAIKDGKGLIYYESEKFKLSEIDIINLIKICLVQRRAVDIGKKILAVYEDTTSHKKEKAQEILKNIGVKIQNEEPEKVARAKSR